MLKKIQKALAIPGTKEAALKDFTTTFQNLGCGEKSENIAKKVFGMISRIHNLNSFEKEIKTLWKKEHVHGKTIFQLIESFLKERSSLVADEIKPYLKGVQGKILDYYCGDGQVAYFLHKASGYPIDGVDVRDFLHLDSIELNFSLLSGEGIIPAENGEYEASYVVNILSQIQDSEYSIRELTRVARKKIIIIETMFEVQTDESDWGRLFLNEFLLMQCFMFKKNSIFGDYKNFTTWKKRFRDYGWHCHQEKDISLGNIKQRLFVFER